MSKRTMMGTLSCLDGKADEMEAVLARMVGAAKQEPGIEVYSYHRGEGNIFFFFALMTNDESMKQHGQTEAMKAVMADFMPLVDGRPQMSMATPIAAIGLDV